MDNQFTGAAQSAGQPEDLARLLASKDLEIAAMQKKLEKYEAIFQGLSDGVLLIDETLSEYNQEACQIWKCEKEDIIGFFPSDFALSRKWTRPWSDWPATC